MSPDLRTAVEGVSKVRGGPQREVRVLQLPGGRVLHRLFPPNLNEVDLNPNTLFLFEGPLNSDPSRVEIWSLRPWHREAVVRLDGWVLDIDHSGRLLAKAWNGQAVVVDLRTGRSRTLGGKNINGLVFSPDGRKLVTWDGETVVWDVATGARQATFPEGSASFSPDGRTLYTTSADGTVKAWDLGGTRGFGRHFRAGSGNVTDDPNQVPLGAAVSPDGRLLATTQHDGRTAVVSLPSGRLVARTAPTPGGRAGSVAWAPDGKSFATTDSRGHVELWDRSGSLVRTYAPAIPQLAVGAAVAFSPDGKVLAASDSSYQVYVWNVRTGKVVSNLSTGTTALGLAFSPDGKTLFAANTDEGGSYVYGWRLPDGQPLYVVNIDSHTEPGQVVASTPDGKLLATAGPSGIVKFLDPRTGKPVGDPIRTGGVVSIDFDPSGRLMVIGGTDGTTRLFDVQTRTAYGAPFPGKSDRPAIAAFRSDGKSVVTVDDEGRGVLWDLRPSAWRQRACEVAGRTLTRAEWKQYLPGRSYHPACT